MTRCTYITVNVTYHEPQTYHYTASMDQWLPSVVSKLWVLRTIQYVKIERRRFHCTPLSSYWIKYRVILILRNSDLHQVFILLQFLKKCEPKPALHLSYIDITNVFLILLPKAPIVIIYYLYHNILLILSFLIWSDLSRRQFSIQYILN